MMNRISTVEEAVTALGGPVKAAKWAGIGVPAIHNWIADGFIPPGRHLRLYIELRRLGYEVAPALFELTEKEWAALRKASEAPRERPKSQRASARTAAA